MSQPLSQQDYNNLLSCLLNALNQNPEVQKQAESYIQSLDSRAGFSSALAEIVSNREADHSARYLASVHLKNSINRNWKKRVAQAGITPEEKAHLRVKLSQLIPQDDNQIAVQVALVYAKVARFDYPSEWPGLFSDLMANLGSSNPLTIRRVYLILHHVLKELSSKRLVADQANFAQVTELLFSHVWGQWCSDTQLLLAGLPGGLEAGVPPQPLLQSCERWMLLLKILRRLILHGFSSDAKTHAPVAAVHSCCPHMVAALQGLLAVRPRSRPAPRSHLQAMLDRATLKLLKTLAQVLEVHPWSFHGAGVLFPTMDICIHELLEGPPGLPGPSTSGSGSSSSAAATHGSLSASLERRLTQCCALLVTAMSCKSYKGQVGALDSGTGQPKDTRRVKALAAEVRAALQAFWAAPLPPSPQQQQQQQPGAAAEGYGAGGGADGVGGSRLVALVGALVRRHMVLSRSNLEQWRDSPEEFAHGQQAGSGSGAGGSWGDSLGLAAEQLYLVLLQAYREVLGPAIASLLPEVQAAAPPGLPADSLPGGRLVGVPLQVLQKDAVYGALAAGAYELYDYLDFRSWLGSNLLQELSDPSPANKPIRRRVGLLVEANVERLSEEDPIRPTVYGSMLGLVSEPDPAVALAGLSALTALLADLSFSEGSFAPLLPHCLQLLLRLLGGTTDLDTQKQAFGLLNLVIGRCGEALRPHVMALAGALPALWEAAAGQSLLRIQILEAVQRLLNLSGPDSPALFPLVMPLLGYSLDLRQAEVAEGLLEDGLALWLVALRNAPNCCEHDPAAAAAAAAAAGAPGTESAAGAAGSAAGGVAAAAGVPAGAPPGALCLRVLPARQGTLEALLGPFAALPAITESSTEHLPLVSALLGSAALVAGPALWYPGVGHRVRGVLLAVVGHVSERGLLLTLPSLELMLQAAPEAAASGLQPVLIRLLALMLGGKETGLVVANSLPVLARLLLVAPHHFEALCGAAAADPDVAAAVAAAAGRADVAVLPPELAPGEVVLWRLLELWAGEFDSIGQAGARRLCALALCRGLGLPSRAVLGLLDLMLPAITAVWFEVEGGGAPGSGGFVSEGLPPSYDYFSAGLRGAGEDGLEEIAGPALDSEEAEGETNRRAMLRDADPAGHLRVGAALRDGLAACATLHGPQLFDAAVGRLDEHVMAAVRTATGAAPLQPAGGQ